MPTWRPPSACPFRAVIHRRTRGLGLIRTSALAGNAQPDLPRGYSPQQLIWARLNRGNPEADLILKIVTDGAYRRPLSEEECT